MSEWFIATLSRPSRGPFYGLVHLDDEHLTEQRGAAADPSLLDKLIFANEPKPPGTDTENPFHTSIPGGTFLVFYCFYVRFCGNIF